jgi:thioredoxin 1
MALAVSTDATFSELTKNGLVLIDFWAEWCGPCQLMLPRLQELATQVEGKAVIAKHNVDEQPQLPTQFRIMSIPTMILFKDGNPVEKWIGVQEVTTLTDAIAKHA